MARLGGAQRLTAVDGLGVANGAALGQTPAEARALAPLLRIVGAEPEEDARALVRLADWCARFSPAVAVDAPDGLLMDIAGCAPLWGGEAGLARALQERLAGQNIPARIAIADTFGAAFALARYGNEGLCLCPGGASGLAAALAPLPVESLRIEADVAAQLRRLGLMTIADVARMPRRALHKRFGAGLVRALARAFGEEDEALCFRRPALHWSVRAAFADPLMTSQGLMRALGDLAQDLCARLDGRGLGARGFVAQFFRVDGASAQRILAMAAPARDVKRLMDLFAPKLETIDPGFGVEAIVLRAARVQALSAAQSDLDRESVEARAADLAPLVDRLRNRLGVQNVWRAGACESHLPERAVRRLAPLSEAGAEFRALARPVRLFAQPQPIEALAPVPDDPPRLIRWRGRTHRIVRAEGPERIGAEWWRAPWRVPWGTPWGEDTSARVRDYYRIEDEAGARLWVFRAGLYGPQAAPRWYVHGLFA